MVAVSVALMSLGAGVGQAVAEEQQDATLHHAQSGALLAYAEAEVSLLYSALLAKELDPDLLKATLKELERSLGLAKKSVDRTMLMLADPKLEPDLKKLLEAVKQAEKQLTALATDIEEQTGEKEKEPSDHREEEEGEKEEPKRDWKILQSGTSWLAADIKDARALHASNAKKLKGIGVKTPPKPSGKREE